MQENKSVFFSEHSVYIHCESKKTPMRTIVHNFVKFLPIFTIFWLAYSAGNL